MEASSEQIKAFAYATLVHRMIMAIDLEVSTKAFTPNSETLHLLDRVWNATTEILREDESETK